MVEKKKSEKWDSSEFRVPFWAGVPYVCLPAPSYTHLWQQNRNFMKQYVLQSHK
jgi:hypothetical protein